MTLTPSKPSSPNPAGKPQAGKLNAVPTTFGPCRILIADDEHLIATHLAAIVGQLNHKVVGVAPDGEQAISLARQHMPDLALLDIRMPKITGIEAAMVLFKELAVPTIIVSAYADEELLGRIQGYGADAGVFGYIIKPVSLDELRVTIGVARQRAAVDSALAARVQQLETNLAHRRIVEQAKWILVEKHKITEAVAHERLQKLARDLRKQLVDVAQIVIDTGDFPK